MTKNLAEITYTLQNTDNELERMESWAALQAYALDHPEDEDAGLFIEKYQRLDTDWTKEVKSHLSPCT